MAEDRDGDASSAAVDVDRFVEKLAERRTRVAFLLTVIYLVVLIAFLLGAGVWTKSLSRMLSDSVSVAMIGVLCVFLAAWSVTAAYTWWASRSYDPDWELVQAREKAKREAGA